MLPFVTHLIGPGLVGLIHREMESGSMQVVYRRQAEGYGVLIPVARD